MDELLASLLGGSEAEPPPVAALRALNQGRATEDAFLRSVVSYDQWLAPVDVMLSHYGQDRFDAVMEFGAIYRPTPNDLWLFTHYAAAAQVLPQIQMRGMDLGQYAGGVRGTTLFRNLSPDWEFIRINPGHAGIGSSLAVGGRAELFRGWADAILFERELGKLDGVDTPALRQAVESHAQFLLFKTPDGQAVTLPGLGGFQSGVAVFTAPDCAQALLDGVPPEQSAGIVRITLSGPFHK